MAKKSYLELAHEDDIKKNTGKDRDKVTYKDLAALDDQETYGKVYNDAIRKLSNSAIWREPKELSDLRKRADTAAYGQSGDLGKFFSDVRDMSDERAKYYAQFGSKDKFVGAQIDNMDKRQVREPSAPVGEADILPKNTNDYLRFQSEQMMGAGPRTIGTNPIAEMMEKQKFFQQTAHDPQALQFAKFTGEYDQMGRDDRLNFEDATIDVERDKLNKDNKSLESEYYNQYAKLYGDNMYFDDYEAEGKKLNELSNKRAVYSDRLSMLDSMQKQVEGAQRWNETKDKYTPYMYAAGFEHESRYDQSKIQGKNAQEYASQIGDPDYTYNYINNPELWEAKTGNNQIFQYENAHLQYMTGEERGIYNYLYKSQGPEAANQMLGDMAEQLRARRSYDQEKSTAQYAKDNPVGSFFEARGRNLQKAVIGPAQTVATLMGKGADDPIFDVNRVSESIDSTNAQELSKAFGGVKIPFLDADAGEVVYGILSSGADAAAAMGIGKLLLGSNAAVQGIMSSGAASSATKSALERGMEPWKAATMGALSGLIEAVTEKYSIEALFSPVDKKAWRFFLKNVFTEGSEELASSALTRITDGLLNADKSEIAQRAQEIARLNGIPLEQAKKQARTEWLQQAGVEFISGAVMGGVFAAPKAVVSSVKNKSNPTPPSTAEQIAKKEAEIAQKEAEAYEAAARERMDFETRDSEAGKKYAELVKLVNESFPEDSETKAKIAEAVTIDTKRMTEIATNAMQELRARMQAEPTPETLKLSETLTQTVEGIFAGMQTDRTAITDKYTAGLDEGLKAEIKGKNDVSYAKGYGIAHALGQMGVSNDTIAKATGFEDAKKAADEGRAKWDIELPKAKNKADVLRKTLPVPGKGGVTYHSNVKQDALTTGQRDQIALLEQVAKPMGYKFVMVEFEKDAAGNYVTDKGKIAPNGYFRDTDGTIYIDVNAGKTAGRMVEDTIIPQTAGHELTHYLKANAPDLFRPYGAAVIEELSAKGQDVNALIAQKIGRAKQSSIGVEAALEEVIADSSAMMLQNTQAIQKMAETNRGLFEKITEWVKDFFERVRKAFSKVEGTPEAKAIMSMRDGVMKYADSLQKMWDDMAVSVAQARVKEEAVVPRRDVQATEEQAQNTENAPEQAASERYQEREDAFGESQMMYSERETDDSVLSFLDNQETVTVYRAMQVIDGKLYPPMAARIKTDDGKKSLVSPSEIGAWEQAKERPELIRDGGKFELDKANGSAIQARYNPYFHTSKSPLNDQFSSAYKRDNLVIVEGEVPISELTSGYRAQYAKDPVGEMKWHSGPVSSKLRGDKSRSVILSRWFKPNRIVPDSEVALKIASILSGEDIEIPYNVVTRSLSDELRKQGVRIKSAEVKDTRYQERDTQYLAAVESGDIDTAQKMVDEAAKEAGYSVKAYHGTPDGGFNIFEGFKYRSLIDNDINYDKSHSVADWFSSGVETPRRLYSVDNRDSINKKQLYSVVLKLENVLAINAKRAAWNKISLSGSLLDGIRKYFPSTFNAETMKSELRTIFTTEEIARYAKRSGYNAVKIDNVSETGDTTNGPFETTYGVFNPNQIKSADPVTYDDSGTPIPLSQRFTDSNDIRYQERDPVPPMYSKMAQEIEAYKGDKMGADSVVKYLTGRGVKADEIRWSGIVPFLQGKKSVSKAELLEFAKASALEIMDVTHKGADYSRADWNEWAENEAVQFEADQDEKTIKVYSNDNTTTDIAYDDNSEVYIDDVTGREFENWDDAFEYARDRQESERNYWLSDDAYNDSISSGSDGPKYDEYSLEDGRRYREILFTAPKLSGNFQSSHWTGNKNVLAHTRLQDFQTPDGKPVLFIEEVQSDWHEKGREQGYKTAELIAEAERENIELERERKEIIKKYNEYGNLLAAREKMSQQDHERESAISARLAKLTGVKYMPDEAPFATTWHEYVLKRVLRMAAEGGYDYVGWTTGKMQAERYSLESVIQGARISKNVKTGDYQVNVDGLYLQQRLEGTMSAKRVVDVFGKEVGARLIEAADKLNGQTYEVTLPDLKVGGEGMKAFYDIGGKSSQNIPRFLNKYGAQWGAKVSEIKMRSGRRTPYTVPAITITPAMKQSVLYEGQALYQERDLDYRTKRDVLAGAFDSVAKTEGEKRNLKEYKNMIGAMNRMEEEARGLRQANTAERKKPDRDKAVIEKNTKRIAEIEDRINNLDKRLLKMQNAAPLQNVLKREVDYYKKQQNALNRQQLEKYRAERAETSIKQRHRADITKGVKSLNTMLMNESDQKHIPEGFKGAVLDFLRLFTDDTSVFDYKRLSVLKEMYDALETSDSELAGMYDFDIAGDIADAARMLEGKRLSQLTEAELESLRDIVAHFNHIVKNENLIFTQKRSVKTTDAAEEGLSEYGKKAKEMRLAILNGKNPIAAINKFLTSKNIKPMYFFKRVGGILQELFDDVRAAQGKWAFQMAEDRNFFRNTVNKYNYYKWVDDGQLTFTTARGDQITLTRDQALELYAINKREKTNKQQGAEHLAIGGFVYNDAVKVKKKSALGVPMTYEVNVGENHPLTDSDLDQISKWLTNEQRAFADEMVNYLSAVMGERGNEVSLALYGIRKYVEKYYFPYKSASNFLYSHQGGVQDDSAIKHRSFTKRTTVNANNPVVLTGFTKVWADHVQNMNLYNAMAVPLDNFNRVYNYRIRGDKDATKAQSVKAALEAAYGKEANAYIKQLLNDVNGGIRPDKGDAEARKMMSLWKKGAVFASLSVVVQQPSAIGRALALVDAKYFRKGYTKAGYEEMMKWSGTANIKAMGRFDANMGMTAAGWLTQREYTGMDEKAKAFAKDGSFRDDVLSWLPQKADEMTWTALWEAVKRETASRHGNLIGSDAFMQKVADRFDEVVDYTQVYDSVLSRSEVMRSQSALAQMVTSFMAEPTTAYNMLLDAIANRKNKGMKNYVKPGRALGAFAVSVMLNSILKAMVTAGRDDDEKYTYLEKYLRKVSGSIADELNPLGLVPYGRDILSLWEGYDVERADMSLIGDLINAAKKASKTDTPILQRMDVLAGAIGNALGIPYKNVRRDIQGVYNVLANTAPMSRQSVSGAKYSILEGLPWFDASRAGYARKLYSAIAKGDAQEEAGLREQISKIVKKDSDINTELRKIITTEFEEERLEPRTALQQMIDLTELKEIKGKIGDWYKDGLIGQDVAEQLLVEFTADDQPNERYKTIEGWNFSKDPDNEGESYSTYKPFYEAIDSGKDLRAVVNTYMDPKKYGATKSTLSGRITDNYKEQYVEAYKRSKTEAAALKARLLNAYVLLGYDRAKKSKDIDGWLKQ